MSQNNGSCLPFFGRIKMKASFCFSKGESAGVSQQRARLYFLFDRLELPSSGGTLTDYCSLLDLNLVLKCEYAYISPGFMCLLLVYQSAVCLQVQFFLLLNSKHHLNSISTYRHRVHS
ncbi:hypothetical protein GJAV_G00044410 [Gymnothorax javanicus]|nr:hypothetical protein GJAV_G00044410 [Gymnothorax javanicus]